MIANPTEYQKAQEELRDLEQRLERVQRTNSIGSKGFTKAGIRNGGLTVAEIEELLEWAHRQHRRSELVRLLIDGLVFIAGFVDGQPNVCLDETAAKCLRDAQRSGELPEDEDTGESPPLNSPTIAPGMGGPPPEMFSRWEALALLGACTKRASGAVPASKYGRLLKWATQARIDQMFLEFLLDGAAYVNEFREGSPALCAREGASLSSVTLNSHGWRAWRSSWVKRPTSWSVPAGYSTKR